MHEIIIEILKNAVSLITGVYVNAGVGAGVLGGFLIGGTIYALIGELASIFFEGGMTIVDMVLSKGFMTDFNFFNQESFGKIAQGKSFGYGMGTSLRNLGNTLLGLIGDEVNKVIGWTGHRVNWYSAIDNPEYIGYGSAGIAVMGNFMQQSGLQALFDAIAVIILGWGVILNIVAYMFGPLTEKRSPSFIKVVSKMIISIMIVSLSKQLISMYFNFFSDLVISFGTYGQDVLLGSSREFTTGITDLIARLLQTPDDYVVTCILMFAVGSSVMAASVTYAERYITLAFTAYLGPVSLAFYGSDQTEDIPKQWMLSVLQQCLGIIVSIACFAMAIMSIGIDYTGLGMDSNASNLTGLVLCVTFLSLSRNSEKFFNALGFRTMSMEGAARAVAAGMGTLVGTAAMAMKAMPKATKGAVAAKGAIDTKLGRGTGAGGKVGKDGVFNLNSSKNNSAFAKAQADTNKALDANKKVKEGVNKRKALENKRQGINGEIEAINNKKAQAMDRYNQASNTAKAQNNKMAELKQREAEINGKLNGTNEAAQQKYRDASASYKSLNSQLGSLKQREAEISGQLKGSDLSGEQRTALNSELAQVRSDRAGVESQINNARQTMAEAQTEMKASPSGLSAEERASLNRDLGQIRSEKAGLEASMNNSKLTMGDLQKEISGYDQELASKNRELGGIDKAINSQQSTNERMQEAADRANTPSSMEFAKMMGDKNYGKYRDDSPIQLAYAGKDETPVALLTSIENGQETKKIIPLGDVDLSQNLEIKNALGDNLGTSTGSFDIADDSKGSYFQPSNVQDVQTLVDQVENDNFGSSSSNIIPDQEFDSRPFDEPTELDFSDMYDTYGDGD